MKIMAWDTSAVSQSVAVLADGEILWETTHLQPSSHTVSLLVTVEKALEESRISLEEIDLFAVTHGPGSFTGLRIGLSTVKAFAAVYGKPVAPVSTLLALAYPFLEKGEIVVPCLDARMSEVYASAFQINEFGEVHRLLTPAPRRLEELRQSLNEIHGKKLFLGSGVKVYRKILKDIPESYILEDQESHRIRASVVGRLGAQMMERGETLSGKILRPDYLRASAAEQKLVRRKATGETGKISLSIS